MTILKYIFYFGLISIVFEILAWFFLLISSLISLPLRIPEKIYQLITKSIQIYFLSAMTSLITLRAIQDNQNTLWAAICYALLGLWLLYMTLGNALYQKRRSAQYDHELKEATKYDAIFIIGAPVLFLIILFIPYIGFNFFTLGAVNIIFKICNLPVIGWIIGMTATVYLLSILWSGLIISAIGIGYCYRKFKKK